MKKFLVALLVLTMIIALFIPAALADPDKDKTNNGKSTEQKEQKEEKKQEQEEKKLENQQRVDEKKQEHAELKEEFQARMLERAELREATKTQLKEQKQIVAEFKQQLKEFKQELEGLSEEERLQYADQLEELKLQIRSAQKNNLEIRKAAHEEIKEILPGVRVGQAPTEEEVEEVIEETLGDL